MPSGSERLVASTLATRISTVIESNTGSRCENAFTAWQTLEPSVQRNLNVEGSSTAANRCRGTGGSLNELTPQRLASPGVVVTLENTLQAISRPRRDSTTA